MDDQLPLLRTLYPLYAPLPIPMVEQLIVRLLRARRVDTLSAAWDVLKQDVREKRDIAFIYMNPFIHNQQEKVQPVTNPLYSTSWLLQTLTNHAPDQRPVTQDTLSKWRRRGLIRYGGYSLPLYDSAAALLITRMIDRGERNFLPSNMREEEPLWWCWRQDAPTTPILPCPIPLPPDVPTSALLWTDWAGASWTHPWIKIGEKRGAIRWSGVRKSQSGDEHWHTSLEQLRVWDPQAASLLQDLPSIETFDQEVEELKRLHEVATITLRRLASVRFGTSSHTIPYGGQHERPIE